MFSDEKKLSWKLYALGLIVIFSAVYSQYIIHPGIVLGFLIVYGIPLLVTTAILGREIIKKARKNGDKALRLGLSLFGAFTIAGIFLSIVALIVILAFAPNAISLLLDRPNPVLQIPPSLAWVMTGASIIVVGPAEEYLFRGFIYGGLLNLFRGKHWISLAVTSSLLFAAVHLYYVVTYGVASAVPLIDLVTFGTAMAMTYYLSGGNIVVPAIIHGVYDATGFIGVATSMTLGLLLRGILIIIGVVLAAVYLRRKTFQTQIPASTDHVEEAPQNAPTTQNPTAIA
jgi:membrane protease YdiL (CAAX protease family)